MCTSSATSVIVEDGLAGDDGPVIAARRWQVQNRMLRERWGLRPCWLPDGPLRGPPRRSRPDGPRHRPLPRRRGRTGHGGDARGGEVPSPRCGDEDLGHRRGGRRPLRLRLRPSCRARPRRLVHALARPADEGVQRDPARRRGRHGPGLGRAGAGPRTPVPPRRRLAPAWCNVCRWAGEAFSGVPHARAPTAPGAAASPVSGSTSTAWASRAMRRAGGCWTPRHAPLVSTPGPWATGTTTRSWPRCPPSAPWGRSPGSRSVRRGPSTACSAPTSSRPCPIPTGCSPSSTGSWRPGGSCCCRSRSSRGSTAALDAADTAAGTARWSFGVDIHERVAAAGFATDLLVTEELADLVAADPSTWGAAPGSGEVDGASVLGACATPP